MLKKFKILVPMKLLFCDLHFKIWPYMVQYHI